MFLLFGFSRLGPLLELEGLLIISISAFASSSYNLEYVCLRPRFSTSRGKMLTNIIRRNIVSELDRRLRFRRDRLFVHWDKTPKETSREGC
jgi:hypothetical protein